MPGLLDGRYALLADREGIGVVCAAISRAGTRLRKTPQAAFDCTASAPLPSASRTAPAWMPYRWGK
jgi:hypothetical protein